MTLPKMELTQPELDIAMKHMGAIKHLEELFQSHQEALNDIMGLALAARGFTPLTHTIALPTGVIAAKAKPEEKKPE